MKLGSDAIIIRDRDTMLTNPSVPSRGLLRDCETDCETDGALHSTIKEIIQAAAAASSAEFFNIYVLLSFV